MREREENRRKNGDAKMIHLMLEKTLMTLQNVFYHTKQNRRRDKKTTSRTLTHIAKSVSLNHLAGSNEKRKIQYKCHLYCLQKVTVEEIMWWIVLSWSCLCQRVWLNPVWKRAKKNTKFKTGHSGDVCLFRVYVIYIEWWWCFFWRT